MRDFCGFVVGLSRVLRPTVACMDHVEGWGGSLVV